VYAYRARPIHRIGALIPSSGSKPIRDIGRALYAYTPEFKVIALDGATGHCGGNSIRNSRIGAPAGIDVLDDGTEQRLFASVMIVFTHSIPATGKPIASFVITAASICERLARDYTTLRVLTSPGIIYKDLAHRRVSHRRIQTRSPGDIRAF